MKALNENSNYYIREIRNGQKSVIMKVDLVDILLLKANDRQFKFATFGRIVCRFLTILNLWRNELTIANKIDVIKISIALFGMVAIFFKPLLAFLKGI